MYCNSQYSQFALIGAAASQDIAEIRFGLSSRARVSAPSRTPCQRGVRADRYGEPNLARVVLSWSSGKDSAWTLHLLRQRPDIQIVALVTTFNSAANRVAMHAVRRTLVEAQAEQTGIPLW